MRKRILSGDIPYDLVEVVWDDAEAQTGWEEPPKNMKPALALSIGFLVAESENHMVISSLIGNGENSTNLRIQIPKGMVVSRKTLQEKSPR